MAIPRDERFVWVTWLTKLMVGDASCEWAPWFRSNFTDYKKAPSDFDSTSWRIDHTRLLRELRSEFQASGRQVLTEKQNQFRYRRPSGLVLSGIPDLVSIGSDAVTVIDAKTGRERDTDRLQVMIYMHCLPEHFPSYRGREIRGVVAYDSARHEVHPREIDAKFVDQLHYYLDILDSQTPAAKVPSAAECRFCDIAKSECPERIEWSAVP